MTEINNNMNKFGYQVEKIPAGDKQNVPEEKAGEVKEEISGKDEILDTGVLGRSQVVNRANNTSASSSIDEAVRLANENIDMLSCADKLFDNVYNQFIEQGFKPKEAYVMASIGLKEFSDISGIALKN